MCYIHAIFINLRKSKLFFYLCFIKKSSFADIRYGVLILVTHNSQDLNFWFLWNGKTKFHASGAMCDS